MQCGNDTSNSIARHSDCSNFVQTTPLYKNQLETYASNPFVQQFTGDLGRLRLISNHMASMIHPITTSCGTTARGTTALQ